MTAAGFVPDQAAVPLPRRELCSQRVLVMDLLRGRKLVDGLRDYVSVLAEADGVTTAEFERKMTDKIEQEGLPALYEGPGATQIWLYQKSLGLYDTTYNAAAATYNALWGGWVGAPAAYSQSKVPINTPELVEKLMAVRTRQPACPPTRLSVSADYLCCLCLPACMLVPFPRWAPSNPPPHHSSSPIRTTNNPT